MTVVNDTSFGFYLKVGPWQSGYSGCITMDEGPGLGGVVYIPSQKSIQLHFWRSGSCHGKQGWLALRAAYNPLDDVNDYQQYWFDAGGSLEKHGNVASYTNVVAATGRNGSTAEYTATFTDALWPADWSKTPLAVPYELAYTNEFDLIWNDVGSGAIFDGSIYQPRLATGFYRLGFPSFGPHTVDPLGGIALQAALTIRPLQPDVIVPPDSFTWIGDDHNSGAKLSCSWWRPNPPAGFVALAPAFSNNGEPARTAIGCIREDLVGLARSGPMTYADRFSRASHDIQTFSVRPLSAGQIQLGISAVSTSFVTGTEPEYPQPLSTLALIQDAAHPGKLTLDQVNTIISESGPILYLHPSEKYLPISAEQYIDKCTYTTTPGEPDHLVVKDKSAYAGDLHSAVAYVIANWVSEEFTDIQFWYCYGYNGAPSIKVLATAEFVGRLLDRQFDGLHCGQHEGDWEHVTLRVSNSSKSVVAVAYSSHGNVSWYAPPITGQVRAYAALNMHGTYPVVGDHYEFLSWKDMDSPVDLEVVIYTVNQCAESSLILDSADRYTIVASNFLDDVETPMWMTDPWKDTRWGKRETHTDTFPLPFPFTQTVEDEGPTRPSVIAE